MSWSNSFTIEACFYKVPKTELTNLNINSHFTFGLLLFPLLINDFSKATSSFNLIIFTASVFGLLGYISASYAFRFGIAVRVQSIIVGVMFMAVILG